MSTNFEIDNSPKDKPALFYSLYKQKQNIQRLVDEVVYRHYTRTPVRDLSVLKIYDEQGREVLSIERNDT